VSSPLPDACRLVVAAAQADSRLPAVAAAVWRRGTPLWEDAVGLADLDGVHATPDHQFRIASITKTFTAAAVFQLRDAGALSLDEPIDVPGLERPPTVRRLLAHLSGLQRESPGADWERGELPLAPEVVARLREVEHVLVPGEEWHYSNLGFVLLGEVVERRSGIPYDEYVEQRLVAPAGLRRTSWNAEPPAATGYFVDPYADRARVQPVLGGAPASGGLWSTVGDLCRWGSFLLDPDPAVLRPGSAHEMHEFQAMADLERWTGGYGLGLMLYRRGDHVFAGHSGGHAGFLSNVAWDRASRTVAAVATNAGAGVAMGKVGIDLLCAALDAEPAAPGPWAVGSAVPDDLEGVLGRWWSEGQEFVFSHRRGRLEAAPAGGVGPAAFERVADDLYRTVSGRERGETLRIMRDADGAVTRLYWSSYPFTREPRAF
jgi:CubicO group peptidase (beta-lactamase class C family)